MTEEDGLRPSVEMTEEDGLRPSVEMTPLFVHSGW